MTRSAVLVNVDTVVGTIVVIGEVNAAVSETVWVTVTVGIWLSEEADDVEELVIVIEEVVVVEEMVVEEVVVTACPRMHLQAFQRPLGPSVSIGESSLGLR